MDLGVTFKKGALKVQQSRATVRIFALSFLVTGLTPVLTGLRDKPSGERRENGQKQYAALAARADDLRHKQAAAAAFETIAAFRATGRGPENTTAPLFAISAAEAKTAGKTLRREADTEGAALADALITARGISEKDVLALSKNIPLFDGAFPSYVLEDNRLHACQDRHTKAPEIKSCINGLNDRPVEIVGLSVMAHLLFAFALMLLLPLSKKWPEQIRDAEEKDAADKAEAEAARQAAMEKRLEDNIRRGTDRAIPYAGPLKLKKKTRAAP